MSRMIVTATRLNMRTAPVTEFSNKANILGVANKGYSFESVFEISNNLGTWYKDRDETYYWGGGLMQEDITVAIAAKPSLLLPPAVVPHDMPLSRTNCIKCTEWMKNNFADKIVAATNNTPFDEELIYAIACQETAQRWVIWINDFDADTILERSVFDASGDFPDTSRSAFPKNKNELLAQYGNNITQMLIEEANKMRAMPQPGKPGGYGPAGYLYKGYGIFQYDLQHIKTDEQFFTNKLWYSIDECVSRVMKELKTKWNLHTNNMFATVKAYNGSGSRAEQYAQRVSQFYTWIKSI